MTWQTAQKAPWGILILFGGGLSLAAAVRRNGVAELIGNQVSALGDVPPIVLVLVVTALVITMGCWAWATRIMRLPQEQRVFPESAGRS